MNEIKSFFRDNFRSSLPNPSYGKPRIEFIDLAKGICIILVVIFHFGVDIPLLRPMRMPLYFILSGLFFKDYGGLINFITKKTNRILIPFLFFVAIAIAISFALSQGSIVDAILMPFYQPKMLNLPIWFLLGLFWVNLIYYAIDKWCDKMVLKCIAVIACGLCGYALHRYDIYLPLFAASAFSAVPFFFTGVLMRKLPILYRTVKDKYFYAVCLPIFAGAIIYCVCYQTPFIDFSLNQYYGNLLAIYVIAVSMVTGLLMICKLVRWLPVISYFGRYSIMTLGLHSIFKQYSYLPLYWIGGILPTAIQNFTITLLLCWIAIPIMRRWLPKLTAQSDLIKRPSQPVSANM